jgi:hypothetical protein
VTALEARRNPKLRTLVALAVDTSQRTVNDLLDGYPPRPGLESRIRAELVRQGVDVETIPQVMPAELARHRVGRAARRCHECERLQAEVDDLRRQLAVLQGRKVPAKAAGRDLQCVPCDEHGILVEG